MARGIRVLVASSRGWSLLIWRLCWHVYADADVLRSSSTLQAGHSSTLRVTIFQCLVVELGVSSQLPDTTRDFPRICGRFARGAFLRDRSKGRRLREVCCAWHQGCEAGLGWRFQWAVPAMHSCLCSNPRGTAPLVEATTNQAG